MFGQNRAGDVWQIVESDYPRAGTPLEKSKFLIRCALLAPSSHNTQPWFFEIKEAQSIELFADRSRWLRVADADQRELHISLGCALENLLVAAAHFGLETETRYLPRGDDAPLAAVVSWREGAAAPDERRRGLFEFLTRRATFHGAFANREMPSGVLEEIEKRAAGDGVRLRLTNEESVLERIAEFVANADAQQFADPEFRRELAAWIGAGVFGNSWLTAQIGRFAVAHFDFGRSTAKADARVLQSAAAFGLLATATNSREAQIKTGQDFERIYLAAQAHGLGVRPLSQIVQLPAYKEKLKETIAGKEEFPQQPFLIGCADKPATAHTPRRPLEELLN